MKNNRRGALTLISLSFLLLISLFVGYRISTYQSQMNVNDVLIHEYHSKTQRLK